MKSKILALALALSFAAPLAASAQQAAQARHSSMGTVYSTPPAEVTAAGAQ
jgi:hypothetical protein